MRRSCGPVLAATVLFTSLACAGGKDVTESGSEDDTVAVVDDSEATGTDDSADKGEIYEPEDPSFRVVLDETEWKGLTGYWIHGGSSTLIANNDSSGTLETVTIEVSGDARWAGTYPVTRLSYALAPSTDATAISSALNPDIELVVSGFSDGDAIFATLSGSASLTGEAGNVTCSGGEVRSWPHY